MAERRETRQAVEQPPTQVGAIQPQDKAYEGYFRGVAQAMQEAPATANVSFGFRGMRITVTVRDTNDERLWTRLLDRIALIEESFEQEAVREARREAAQPRLDEEDDSPETDPRQVAGFMGLVLDARGVPDVNANNPMDLPDFWSCPTHHEQMQLRHDAKSGQRWYSHHTASGWCKGGKR